MTDRTRPGILVHVAASLPVLDAEIDQRVDDIRRAAPDWPCAAGCAACCRNLAAPHLLSAPEWRRLDAALDALEGDRGAEVRARLDEMADLPLGNLTCPVLDPSTHRCLTYAARPLACRTHGYYATRDGGFWCEDIEANVADGGADGVVFGHHEALEREARARLGEGLTWREWRAAREGAA